MYLICSSFSLILNLIIVNIMDTSDFFLEGEQMHKKAYAPIVPNLIQRVTTEQLLEQEHLDKLNTTTET